MTWTPPAATELPLGLFGLIVEFNVPGAYAWFVGEQCLYVGSSERVLKRLATHQKVRPEPGHKILIWRTQTAREALALERLLQGHYQPKLCGINDHYAGRAALTRWEREHAASPTYSRSTAKAGA